MTPPEPRIGAVVLAAGEGRRMGGPKLFAKVGDETFVQLILRRLAEAAIAPVVVVVAAAYLEEARHLLPATPFAVNPDPTRGMLSSLHLGIEAVGALEGYLVVSVDHPEVQVASYRALVKAFRAVPKDVVKPTYGGRGGHPLVIPFALASQLGVDDIRGGLATLVRASGLLVRTVELDDPGVVRNFNTPQDLAPR